MFSKSFAVRGSAGNTWTGLVLLIAIYLFAWLSWMLLPGNGDVNRQIVAGLALLPVRALTVLLAWQIASHPSYERRSRQAWRLLSLGFLALLLSDLLHLLIGSRPLAAIIFSFLSLTFYLALLGGLLRFSTVLLSSDMRERFGFDLSIVMLSGGIAIWYFLIHPAPIELANGLLATTASLVKPTGDLAILFGAATVLLTTPEAKNRRPFALLILGILVFFAADLTYGHISLYDQKSSSIAVDLLSVVSACLLFLSCQQMRSALSQSSSETVKVETTTGSFRLLPYLAIAFVFALLVYSAYRDWANPLGGLIVGAVALTGLVISRQISAVRASERAQRVIMEKETRFKSLVQRSSDVITILNRDLSIQFSSPSVSHVLGYDSDQLAGKKLTDLIHPSDRTLAIAFFTDLLKRPNSAVSIEWRLLHADNTWRNVENSCTNLMDEPTIAGLVLNSIDITGRKQAEDKLQHDAFHDSLTGLPNRALFKEYLKTAIGRSKRSKGHLFAVLFCDLDRFKNINDSLGHTVGDELLISIGRRLEQSIRENIDIVARLGGDEFAILLDGMADANVAMHIARRIQDGLKTAVEVGGHEIFSTTSIGIALSATGYANPEEILRDADTAMYRAKARGRACYEVFDKFMHARAVALLQLENDLRRAVERNEFEVYYQPIVSLKDDSKITGFEALVRWHHPTRGLVGPLEFISVAEDTGQIIHLGKWVLEQACRQMKEWQDHYPRYRELTLSVNLSGKQFLQANLVEQIRDILRNTGFDPRHLQLEITESVVIENTEIVTETLMRLHALGIQLTMDDFGTGYSSLSYLHNFPIDVLKIDRSFISRKGGNSKSQIVSTIITLARNMGLKVVAEGVETEEQLEHLKDLQCAYGQGFLFSHPVTAKQTEELIGQTDESPVREQIEPAA
jgi:diguanylate cyclase (GGDEF)-like protein/PAS domain S-box-containing protein